MHVTCSSILPCCCCCWEEYISGTCICDSWGPWVGWVSIGPLIPLPPARPLIAIIWEYLGSSWLFFSSAKFYSTWERQNLVSIVLINCAYLHEICVGSTQIGSYSQLSWNHQVYLVMKVNLVMKKCMTIKAAHTMPNVYPTIQPLWRMNSNNKRCNKILLITYYTVHTNLKQKKITLPFAIVLHLPVVAVVDKQTSEMLLPSCYCPRRTTWLTNSISIHLHTWCYFHDKYYQLNK